MKFCYPCGLTWFHAPRVVDLVGHYHAKWPVKPHLKQLHQYDFLELVHRERLGRGRRSRRLVTPRSLPTAARVAEEVGGTMGAQTGDVEMAAAEIQTVHHQTGRIDWVRINASITSKPATRVVNVLMGQRRRRLMWPRRRRPL
jgi:hypothetical protein